MSTLLVKDGNANAQYMKETGAGTAGDPFVPSVNVDSALPAGSAIIGKVGIDQTTPGTTNLVAAGGNVAAGAVNAGNPLGGGLVAYNPDTPQSAVDAGDRQFIMGDLNGRPVTYLGTTLDSVNDSIACLGNVAHDAVDSGNPVKMGVKATSSLPTQVAALDRADVLGDRYGRVGTFLGPYDGSTTAAFNTVASDSYNSTIVALHTLGHNVAWDGGSNWNRVRNNHEVTALISAARTASINSSDLINYNGRGVQVVIDVTAVTATPDLTVTIKGKCSLSGKYFTLLASASISTVSTTVLTVYPGATVAANLSASAPLVRVWRVEVVAGDADSATYSISANYIN